MDSSNLSKLGFSQWYPFNKQNLKNAPPETGVYVLRKCGGELFGRLNGQSDILYIGSTKKSLKSRLQQYIHPGPTQWTNQRIHKYTKENSVEASWLSCNEPKSLEHDLLKQYYFDHGELPPLNFTSVRKLLKVVEDEVHVTDEVTVIKK